MLPPPRITTASGVSSCALNIEFIHDFHSASSGEFSQSMYSTNRFLSVSLPERADQGRDDVVAVFFQRGIGADDQVSVFQAEMQSPAINNAIHSSRYILIRISSS